MGVDFRAWNDVFRLGLGLISVLDFLRQNCRALSFDCICSRWDDCRGIGNPFSPAVCFLCLCYPRDNSIDCRILFLADLIHATMGIMLLIFLAMLSFNAQKTYQVIRRSFMLRYEKDNLIAHLELSKTETEAAESELSILSEDLERQVRIELANLRKLTGILMPLPIRCHTISKDLSGLWMVIPK